ncbi:maleylpyruvate isomerase family mycothiol-dependent enzyme [Actinoplanes subtropicus]|uniref:maleylpyruvate isomerase family mycothiol-dependent enzyme n=1 Tax=Actinoplanes subtropicus TaxID=543632 RepID=UPI0004C34BD1|nr:maleylpyruvate isomerase family mycothiol-dependent enzyme [Actinoplanes subtropicus]
MPTRDEMTTRDPMWPAIHAERAALAADLERLGDAQWAHRSLCGAWTVEQVVAHLTAGASTGRVRWLASIIGARFDAGLHNQRRLAEHLGATPAETLDRFRRILTRTTAPSGHTAAWLGEIVVHGQDIRHPLGLPHTPPVETVEPVARFYASRNFTVAGRTMIEGLRLAATDSTFTAGTGAQVRGTTLALTMAMAGRAAYCDDLTGAGVPTLRKRCGG